MRKGTKKIKVEPKTKEPGVIDIPLKPEKFTNVNNPEEPIHVIAIIPARSGSKGIENKNVRHIGGRILIDHTIRQARAAGLDILISTDSVQYKDKIDAMYQKENYCPFIRPANLSDDTASSASVVLHALNWLELQGRKYDIIVLLEPTNPVRQVSDITVPLAYFKKQRQYDSLVSIVNAPEHHPLLAMESKPIRGEEKICILVPHGGRSMAVGHPRRQALNDAYFMNGGLYMSWVDKFKVNKMFDVNPCLGWRQGAWQSHEIDTEDDIPIVEYFIRRIL